MRNIRYKAFAIVTPGFSESESDIGNNIPGVSSDILGISNRKKRYTRYINNMWQSTSIYVAFINNAASAYRFSFNGYPSFFKWQYFYLSTALAVLDICKCTVSTNLRFMWSYLREGEVPFYVRKGAVFSHPPARSTQ